MVALAVSSMLHNRMDAIRTLHVTQCTWAGYAQLCTTPASQSSPGGCVAPAFCFFLETDGAVLLPEE